jgi:hypothetical protein
LFFNKEDALAFISKEKGTWEVVEKTISWVSFFLASMKKIYLRRCLWKNQNYIFIKN